MTDPRPRPKYGEYAPIDPTKPPEAVVVPDQPAQPSAPTQPLSQPGVPAQPHVDSLATKPAVAPRAGWDLILTTGLLLFGVYSVATSFSQLDSLGTVMAQLFAAQGLQEFTSYALASQVGVAMNILQAVLLVITIVISLLLLSRRKIAFYVPIAGAFLTSIVFTICIAVVMIGDPAFSAMIGQ